MRGKKRGERREEARKGDKRKQDESTRTREGGREATKTIETQEVGKGGVGRGKAN